MSLEDELARCGPWLQAALERDGLNGLTEVAAEVASGRSLLWPGRAAAAVTEQTRDLHIWLAGGDLRELLAMEQDCARWAKANGFDRLTIEGRKGWERVLSGYRARRLLVKEL